MSGIIAGSTVTLSSKEIDDFVSDTSSPLRLNAIHSEGMKSSAMIYIIDVLNVGVESLIRTKLVKVRLISPICPLF